MKNKNSVKRIVWLVIGCVSFGLGTLGTFLPILPTVPLYLLAAVGFANWSTKLHNWFMSTKLYKRHLEGYVKAGGLTLRAKMLLMVWVTLQIGIVACFFANNFIVQLILGVIWFGFMISMLFIVKTVKLSEKGGKEDNTQCKGRDNHKIRYEKDNNPWR